MRRLSRQLADDKALTGLARRLQIYKLLENFVLITAFQVGVF